METLARVPVQPVFERLWGHRSSAIAVFALTMILLHVLLRYGLKASEVAAEAPLFATYAASIPLLLDLVKKLFHREFGSDVLAGVSIVASAILDEDPAGSIVVLMLSGGNAIESFAVRNASSVLRALAKRVPSAAHRKVNSSLQDITLGEVAVGDSLVIFPHEICPVDGVVTEGHSVMDESFLTGEPFRISKTPGSEVISGAVNGASALTIRASRLATDSRYAKIMEVMRASEQRRPHLRRLGDQLGAIYTPLAVGLAILAWVVTGDPIRFLAVLVIATPCPLLIGIPVAIIGSISRAARRGIVVKNPAVLEQIEKCTVGIFDKTGTLTYGEPKLAEQIVEEGFPERMVLALAASLELYSKHPLARAILAKAKEERIEIAQAEKMCEPPGQGLSGSVRGHVVQIISRKKLRSLGVVQAERIPPPAGGLECFVVIDGCYAGAYRFRDAPRAEGFSFIRHLGPKHHFDRIMIISGDRESEVRYLAEQVGVAEIHARKTPEQKLQIVEEETAKSKTAYIGDGINDAPAMMAATVGIAIGAENSDITAEAADVVVMEGALKKIDEFLHIGHRMRRIALQSAVGGMALSLGGMGFAAAGFLSPVAGALIQEAIDVLAVLNALRAAFAPKEISDIQ